ncbi:MAG: hypothetical protein HYY24_26535 [Verrucomicrobia bacterium]|nr:hypothetical protein [Verrucomicrobiota bacterium]
MKTELMISHPLRLDRRQTRHATGHTSDRIAPAHGSVVMPRQPCCHARTDSGKPGGVALRESSRSTAIVPTTDTTAPALLSMTGWWRRSVAEARAGASWERAAFALLALCSAVVLLDAWGPVSELEQFCSSLTRFVQQALL